MPALSAIKNYALTALVSGAICMGIGWQLGYSQVKVDKEKADLLGKIPSFDLNTNSLQPETGQPSEITRTDLQKIWGIWNLVTTGYLEKDKVTKDQLVEGAMKGIVAALNDPYSAYLDKEQTKLDNAAYAGTFEGVGINLGFNKDKQLIVIAPIPGSPAERAGILAGDKIGIIEKKLTSTMTLAEAANMLRGQKGTKVKVTLQHESGEIYERELQRDTIYIRSVENKELENGKILYIRVNRFGDTTNKEWDEAVEKAISKKISKIIIDLRNNPGGYIESAVHINADFMPGLLFEQVDYKGESIKYNAKHDQRLANTQVVILVNKGTASSSEIMSGGLQEAGKAKLVGETTFGKGILQTIMKLPEDTSIHLTTGKWLLPSGKWIHRTGVTPDYEVKVTETDLKNSKDPQLDKATALLLK